MKLGWWQRPWGFLALALLAALTVLLMTTPVLGDLPAHVARFHVQQDMGRSPLIARSMVFEWRFVPNMGVDLAVAALAPLLGVEPATQIVTAALPALIVLALLLIARDVHGRVPWTTLYALPLAFAYPFVFGFVNYWLSVGLALIAFALWLHLTRTSRPVRRACTMAVLSPLVLVSHLAGFGILGILCFGSLLGRAIEKKQPILPAIVRAGLACLPIAWPILFLVIWKEPAEKTGFGGWFDLDRLVIWAAAVLRTRWMAIDIASAVLVYAVALLPLIARRRFRWALPLFVPAVLLGLVTLLLPRHVNGSDYVSVRIIPVVCAIAILAVRPLEGRSRLGELGGLAFFAGRAAILFFTLAGASAHADRELVGLRYVKPGARIAAFHISQCVAYWEPRYLVHLQSMAMTRRDAMVNDHFAAATGQLLHLSAAESRRPAMPSNDVRTIGCHRPQTASFDSAYRRLDLRSVDYVWIIDLVGQPWPRDPRLKRIWSGPDSAIFEVRH